MTIKSKKGVGPDFLISILVLGLIGLGGVFFLNVFVNGIAMHGVLAIIDSEMDQRCFYILLPLIGDDYIRAGINISQPEYIHFAKAQNFYKGHSVWMDKSYEIESASNTMSASVLNSDFAVNMTYFRAYAATVSMADKLRNETYTDMIAHDVTPTQYCTIPIYGPSGEVGLAELFIAERLKTE